MDPEGRSSKEVRGDGGLGLDGEDEWKEDDEGGEGKEGLLSLIWEFEACVGLNEEGAGADVGRLRNEGHAGGEGEGGEAGRGREAE